jgi:hypothetical protein
LVSLTCVLVGAIFEEVNLAEKKQWQGFLRLFDSFFVSSPQVDCALHPIGINADHDLDDFTALILRRWPALAHLLGNVVERLPR